MVVNWGCNGKIIWRFVHKNVKGTVSIFGIGSFSVQGHCTAVLISQKPGLRFVGFAPYFVFTPKPLTSKDLSSSWQGLSRPRTCILGLGIAIARAGFNGYFRHSTVLAIYGRPKAEKSLGSKSFSPCYSKSPQQLRLEISISLNSCNLLQLLQCVTVQCKGERR